MSRAMLVRIGSVACCAALLVLAGCLLVPEDKETGTRVDNLRPNIRITGGALAPDSAGVDYKVSFQWSGSDDDGLVVLYQWATDDTTSESAWRDTTGFRAQILFQATSSNPHRPNEYSDWHSFYIRAIDNEFATSRPAKSYFNARTIAPSTRIVFPDMRKSPTPQLQPTVTMKWEGEDVDSSDPDQQPAFYEYKLCYLTNPDVDQEIMRDSLYNGNNVLIPADDPGSRKRWLRVPADTTEVILHDLEHGHDYCFSVRAIDEAGAVEPALDKLRNIIGFCLSTEPSTPRVTICEGSLGCFTFNNSYVPWRVQVPVGRELRFKWTGDASHYGSEAGKSNYALNIPDPEDMNRTDPNGIGGWIGWANWAGNQKPIVFTAEQAGSIYPLYVYMRDISDTESSTAKCTILLEVVNFSFNRLALVVDDAKFTQANLGDRIHDAFIYRTFTRVLRRFDLGRVDTLNIYRGGDKENSDAAVLDLSQLAPYQNIIWTYATKSGDPGIFRNEVQNQRNLLSTYLGAGGRLFLVGGQIAGALRGQFPYGEWCEPSDQDQKAFWYKFMKFRNGVYSVQGADFCARSGGGLYIARSMHPMYPDLQLDPARWNPWEEVVEGGRRLYRGGITFWEGSKRCGNDDPVALEGLDSLYYAQTWDRSLDPTCLSPESPSSGAIIGLRYESTAADTLLGNQHGRLALFDFEPSLFIEDLVLNATSAALTWLVHGRDQ